MGLSDPTSLKFDNGKIAQMRTQIQTTAEDLASLKQNILQNMEKLKSDWNTPAGRKFTQEVDTDWAQQVDKYITIMNAIDELLGVAENAYTEVEGEVEKLSF